MDEKEQTQGWQQHSVSANNITLLQAFPLAHTSAQLMAGTFPHLTNQTSNTTLTVRPARCTCPSHAS